MSTDQEVKSLLKKTKKRLKELNQGDSTDAFALLEEIQAAGALSTLANQMAEDASSPPLDANGRPILTWTNDAGDQQRVISYLMERVHNLEVGLYNTASVLAATIQIGLFLGTGKRSGIFGSGANSAILPLLLLNFNGASFPIFGTAKTAVLKVWNGVFGR